MPKAISMTVDQLKEWKKTGVWPDEVCAQRQSKDVKDMPTHRFAGLAKGRVATRGVMNITEGKWAAELELQRIAGLVLRWWFEPLKLRLSDPAPGQQAVYFMADFLIWLPDGAVLIDDVKGGVVNEASIVRIKMAATLFPLWKFRLVHKIKKSAGDWKIINL